MTLKEKAPIDDDPQPFALSKGTDHTIIINLYNTGQMTATICNHE